MTDLDTLRPEVREAVMGADKAFNHTGLFTYPYWQTIRAELVRLAEDAAMFAHAVSLGQRYKQRAERAEAELAALKERIAVAPLVEIANIGDPFIVLPDHFTVPNSLKGKTVRLVVEE